MEQEKIVNIFKNLDININKITPATNSFNSNVYLVDSEKEKYIFKINTNKRKTEVESKYMNYLHQYIKTPKVISSGIIDGNSYIIMTFINGKSISDEDGNKLSEKQLKNIGILLGNMHNLPLIDEDDDSWISYLENTLDKTQEILSKVFEKENEVIYNYLKNYITKKLKKNYKNSILHMDFRIGNLIIDDDVIGLIDMESMKNGEYVFDFVKMFRILNENNFNKLLNGYKEVKNIDSDFINKLNFYTLFDSYTSLWWSISKNNIDSDFYKKNYEVVKEYLETLHNKD